MAGLGGRRASYRANTPLPSRYPYLSSPRWWTARRIVTAWSRSVPPVHPPTRPLARAKTPRTPSPLGLRLMVLIRASGFEERVAEYPFARHLGRRWRFDFAWPALMLAVEVDGGAWVPGGGRHTRGAGFVADHDKMNRATLLGWRVLQFTSRYLADGSALADLAEALGDQPR